MMVSRLTLNLHHQAQALPGSSEFSLPSMHFTEVASGSKEMEQAQVESCHDILSMMNLGAVL